MDVWEIRGCESAESELDRERDEGALSSLAQKEVLSKVRKRITWLEAIRNDMIIVSLTEDMAHSRNEWKNILQGSKMLKPEKWQTVFNSDGKVLAFQKVLKLIILGGVDPSIRAEVWEFLLGCYDLNSTAEDRKQLRMARREKYEDLIRQCQGMHSSIGTGSLAYVVGSKVMDMRTSSKDNDIREAATESGRASHDTANTVEADTTYSHVRKCSTNLTELVSVRANAESAAYDSSYVPSSGAYDCFSTSQTEMHEPQYLTESLFNFPSLPFSNLFTNADNDMNGVEMHDGGISVCEHPPRYDDEHMHSFQISNNVDLIMESNASSNSLRVSNSENEIFRPDVLNNVSASKEMKCNTGTVSGLRIMDAPEIAKIDGTASNGNIGGEDRVSEWLWTLHRIVVDVVRTDSHLEFYEDAKNMARMSDILAVYAWVDPATGYCQGMSDLLSPFVVLYEDNADAFWCFEMLLRRVMEGPTGVMKQLQALWKILELTDAEIFEHLSAIGAESLHFAFRMLLVLFRRELSFTEALCMWEMMWAADFGEAMAQQLEENCLEPLVLQLRKSSSADLREGKSENGKRKYKSPKREQGHDDSCSPYSNGLRSISNHPFCGLTKATFWVKDNQLHGCTTAGSTRNGDDELPVFCVAAILILNRQKIMRQTRSIDDVIKIFNDNELKIKVKRCIRMAIKLRKKYFYKLNKQTSMGTPDQR
ncbi:small G protein signaling modulator 1-like isoform X2 [Asparagus officinalis]|uniref:small G protein signaling modulator 1-like isoform X2 n=1 Tax=Asparagus officinalis TaxID=4686 RepID=UPI00098E67E9|nr:small G protein signaling modulator 1-like isoform X2 [Asparagus officinalis]